MNQVHSLAFPEAIIGVVTQGHKFPIEDEFGEIRVGVPRLEHAVFVMFHWPWSLPGDIDSHSLLSSN